MVQPKVNITELDGALGILPPTAGRLMAFVGASTGGTLAVNTPSAYARVPNLVAAAGQGPVVEAAARYIAVTGKPALIVRTEADVAAAAGTVVKVGAGTSVPTVGDLAPLDDFELVIKFIVGGTQGVAGATYQVSYDGGYNYGPTLALGVATSITAGGVEIEFAAGTFVADETVSVSVTAAQWNGTNLTDALAALGLSTVQWESAYLVGALSATTAAVADSAFVGFRNSNKYRSWYANARVPDLEIEETEAEYLTAMSTEWSGFSTVIGAIGAGAARVVSGVTGRNYRRPIGFAFVPAQAVSEEVNIADINLGALPGVSIRDANGNVDEHDESANPGLDDLGLVTLRTWDSYPGVYINRPLIKSTMGSDFSIIPYRRVMNLAELTIYAYLVRRLNKPIRVDATTGFILETEALEIEAGGNAALATALLAKPKASAVEFVVSRTDNILSSKTIHTDVRVIPLAYPETINTTISFYNPALAVQAA
jgi:hypothetical protein